MPGGGGGGNGAAPDAGGGGGPAIDAPAGGGSGSGSATTPDGGAPDCINQQASPGSGHHNAGQDCQQGCHNHGFTMSGTLYAAANSNTPVIGATIVATDANNQVVKMVTMNNGNFYTSTPVTFPVTVYATSCPNKTAMVSQVTAGNGGCNKTGCHAAGAQGKIHLP